jgi:hypothetical protein
LLREKYHTDSKFNLFSVLRSDSDEVRLHSRFIAEILNPKGSHSFGSHFLSEFLKLIDVELKSIDSAVVFTEYKNIDILIKINDIAIVIENKIYAADQDKQLTNYYESIRNENFEHIHLVYLTLNGVMPSDQSISGLDKAFLDSTRFQCLSYKEHIHRWIDNCLYISAKEPPLRESFAQYLELIEKLTAKVKSAQYMNELKQLINTEDNLANCLDLQEAFNNVLIDLQVDLWKRFQKSAEILSIELSEKSIASEESKIASIRMFMKGRRNSNCFGLFYPISDGVELAIRMEGNEIFAGVSCHNKTNPTRNNEITMLLKNKGHKRSENWPCYRYIEPRIHYKYLKRDDISALASEEIRQEISDKTACFLHSILETLVKAKKKH